MGCTTDASEVSDAHMRGTLESGAPAAVNA
jgi:hypothetical protein